MKIIYWIFVVLVFSQQALSVFLTKSAYKVEKAEIKIPSFDGTKLSALYYRPIATNSSDRFPVLLMPASWGMPNVEYFIEQYRLAEEGYVCLSYTARGWWESGGYIDTAGPDDLKDGVFLINWLTDQPWQVDDKSIGMFGISLGAGISMIVGAHDQRVKTIIPMSGWTHILDDLTPQGSPAFVFGLILDLMASVPMIGRAPASLYQITADILFHRNQTFLKSYAFPRSPASYLDLLNARTNLSIFLAANQEDQLFPPNLMLKFYEQLRIPKRLDLSQGFHATAEIIAGLEKGSYLFSLLKKWIDYHLMGIDNGVMDLAPVSFQFLTQSLLERRDRLHFKSWPSPEIKEVRYYLDHRGPFELYGKLTRSPPTTSKANKIKYGVLTGMGCGIPVVSEFFSELLYTPITSILELTSREHAIVFHMERKIAPRHIVGSPTLTLAVKPSQKNFQINTFLYAMNTIDGVGVLLSYGTTTFWNGTTPDHITIDMFPVTFNLTALHTIAVGVSLHNLLYSQPAFKPDYTVEMLYHQECYLTLPSYQ
eukprot:NODE_1544_length_1691_cov_13.544005_g1466_i0.p1 GENE.NODE_1544_length_1691_cov_13.544005_g1466_i0~~NODE_1544_length_1691_cov_13.544005_g1466_i0.p1  ORF type:complete len:549 (-),score=86.44 NODE_1544_length_1691_cov_13.544005_g1466_i0:45-1658(-)